MPLPVTSDTPLIDPMSVWATATTSSRPSCQPCPSMEAIRPVAVPETVRVMILVASMPEPPTLRPRTAPMSAATTFDWLMPAPARTPNSPYEIPEILAMLPPASTLSSSMPKPVWACPRMLPMFRPATRLVSEMPKPAMLPKVLMLARSRVATIEVVSMLPSVTVIGPISVPRR